VNCDEKSGDEVTRPKKKQAKKLRHKKSQKKRRHLKKTI